MQIEARTFAGRFRQIGGGVGRNLADALGRLGMSPRLVSAVGDDLNGKFLLTQTLNHLVRYISITFKIQSEDNNYFNSFVVLHFEENHIKL